MAEQNYPDLDAAVQEQVAEENNEEWMDGKEWVVEVNTHADGPALDIWKMKHGERVVPDKVPARLIRPAIEEGYVPSGTNRSESDILRVGPHIRIFLRDAEVYGLGEEEDIEMDVEDARLEGFATGLLAATMWHAQFASLEALYPETQDVEPMDKEEALDWVREHNTFDGGAVIDSESNNDTEGHLYVHAPNADASEVELPDNWYAFNDLNGVAFRPEGDDHIEAWDGFFEGSYDSIGADDIDANEIVRELEGVETAEECVDAIRDEHGAGSAHVSGLGPDGENPYTIVNDDEHVPDGWERWENDGNYLVKK